MRSAAGWLVLRTGRGNLSVRLDRRLPGLVLFLVLLNVVILTVSLSAGDYPIGWSELPDLVFGTAASNPEGVFVVRELRLPRALVAMLAGAALAVSGALFQGLTRNVLAAPSILGITQAAALFAVATIVLFPGLPPGALSIAAFAGAATGAGALWGLAWRDGGSSARLILVGVGIAALATAGTTLLVAYGNIYRVERALVWMMGSVNGRGWMDLSVLAPWLVVLLPAALLGGRALDALAMGTDLATGLGRNVARDRLVLLAVAVGLAGAAIAVAGGLIFVGLIAPHIARRVVGPSHTSLVPVTCLVGASLVGGADLAARTALSPVELPCGIITSVLGAPFFLYLLFRPSEAQGATA